MGGQDLHRRREDGSLDPDHSQAVVNVALNIAIPQKETNSSAS